MTNEVVQNFPLASYTGLNADLIANDIRNFIRENPDYSTAWEDFLTSTPSNILISLFSQITHLLSSRIDFITNEGFTGLATQDVSKFRFLKLLNYKLSTTVAAEIPVEVSVGGGDITLFDHTITIGYKNGVGVTPAINFSPKTITSIDATGNIKSFEFISFNKELDKYNYFEDVVLNSLTIGTDNIFRVNAYEGITVWEDFLVQGENFAEFTLSKKPVIKNSLVVYQTESLSGNTINNELQEVTSFLEPKAQNQFVGTTELPKPYVREVSIDGTIKIAFGSSENITPERRLKRGDTIRAYYRVGGGLAGNVPVQTINLNESVSKVISGSTINYVVNYINSQQGSKGSDAETLVEAVYRAPRQIRTAGRLVTVEDYETIIGTNPNVIKSKSYGQFNLPPDFEERYGFYPNPMDVWNFVLMKKPNWETLLPSQYSSFEWLTTNLQNHFNGEYYFRKGELGVQLTPDTYLKYSSAAPVNFGYGNTRTLKNYYVLDTPLEFKDNVYTLPVGYAGEALTIDNRNLDVKFSFSNINVMTTVGAKKRVEYENSSYQILPDSDKTFIKADDFLDRGYYEMFEDIFAEYRLDITDRLLNSSIDIGIVAQNLLINLDSIDADVLIDFRTAAFTGSGPTNMIDVNGGFTWSIPLGTADPTNPAHDALKKGFVQVLNYLFDNLYSETTYPYYQFSYTISSPTSFITSIENIENTVYGVEIILDGVPTTFTINTGYDQRWFIVADKLNYLISLEPTLAGNVYFVIEDDSPNVWKLRLRCNNIATPVSVTITNVNIEANPNLFYALDNTVTGVAYTTGTVSYASVCSLDTSSVVGKTYFVMRSPVKGFASKITFKTTENQAYTRVFGITYSNQNLYCYGQKRLSVSVSGTPSLVNSVYTFSPSSTFGKLYYEGGAFNATQPQIYLNYVYENNDSIFVGDHLLATRAEAARLIYNTILTERNVGAVLKVTVDKTLSIPIVKVTQNPIQAPAIYSIAGMDLVVSTPAIKEFDTSSLAAIGTGETFLFKIQIDAQVAPSSFTLNSTTLGGVWVDNDDFFAKVCVYLNASLSPQVYNGPVTVVSYNSTSNVLKFTTKDVGVVGKIIFVKSASSDFLSLLLGVTVYNTWANETYYYVNGDYQLEWIDDNYQYKFSVTNNPLSLIGDGVNYFHFVEDNRLIRRVAAQRGDDLNVSSELYDAYFEKYKVVTDEDELNSFLEPYRIVGIQNQFKQPVITPFTISADVYVSASIGVSQVKRSLEAAIYQRYNLENAQIGVSLSKSEIIAEMIKVNGVIFVDFKYLGKDPKEEFVYKTSYNDVSTDVKLREFIDCTFDELLVLSENVIELSRQVAGFLINYKVMAGK